MDLFDLNAPPLSSSARARVLEISPSPPPPQKKKTGILSVPAMLLRQQFGYFVFA